MRNTTKGQAAVEFLVTYGWAILGAMIAIGALSYFGIFNTQRYVKDVCYFGDQITCEDYAAFSNGTIGIKLRNSFGVDIDIKKVVIKSDYGIQNCSLSRITPNASTITPGTLIDIKCNITASIPPNSKLKYRTILTFEHTGSGNQHNQTGDVSVTVQR